MTNEEMFNNNVKLAYKIANMYRINYAEEYDDIKQLALEGLWKAIINYNNSTRFSTYAYIVMHNNIRMYLRKIKSKNSRTFSIEEPIRENLTYESAIADDIDWENLIISKVDTDGITVEVLLNMCCLSPRERSVALLRIRKKKQIDMAKELGVSQAVISRTEKRIKNKVKKILY